MPAKGQARARGLPSSTMLPNFQATLPLLLGAGNLRETGKRRKEEKRWKKVREVQKKRVRG